MKRARWTVFLPVVLVLAGTAAVRAASPELWVVTDRSARIAVVSTELDYVVGSIDVADPDADGTTETPYGLAFATAPASVGQKAFVTQENLVTPVDVPTRLVGAPVNVGALIADPRLRLRGVAAAAPRRFIGTTGRPELRSFLYVAGNLGTGEPVVVVLDQVALLSSRPPLVDWKRLGPEGTALDVHVEDMPHGAKYQLAWVTLKRGSAPAPIDLAAVEVSVARQLGLGWSVGERHGVTVTGSVSAPETLRAGGPLGGELPVFPEGPLGTLRNLHTKGSCTVGGNLAAVEVAGPGLNSYTVVAVDSLLDRMIVVDALDCSVAAFPTGDRPVDVVTLGALRWTSAFSADRGNDRITRVDRDGRVTTILIAGGIAPCVHCPLTLAVVPGPSRASCVIDDLAVRRVAGDGDGVVNDLELTWDQLACPEAAIWCECFESDPGTCPCECDCTATNPDRRCACPGIGFTGPGSAATTVPAAPMAPAVPTATTATTAPMAPHGPGDLPLQAEVPGIPSEDSWKWLGINFGSPPFIHHDVAVEAPSWGYGVASAEDVAP